MKKFSDKTFLGHLWSENKNSIWISSFLRLHRNLKTHHFPNKLEGSFLADLTQMLCHPIEKAPTFKGCSFSLMKDLKPEQKELLFEYFLFRHNYPSFHGHEGLLIGPKLKSHILINTTDHLILDHVDTTNHLEEAWNQLMHIENDLSKEIEFAFSSKFGFLTSQVNQCGTGLCIDLILHLPALVTENLIFDELQKNESYAHQFTSLYGKNDEFIGNIVVLSNRQTFGISEEQLLKSMHSVALNLVIAEKRARDAILKDSGEIKNEISKAFGTLKHAYQLDMKEAMQALSLCKLGLELGWIGNIAPEKVNALLFSMGKGHLNFHDEKSSQEINEKRSLRIQKELQDAKL